MNIHFFARVSNYRHFYQQKLPIAGLTLDNFFTYMKSLKMV